MQYKQFLKEIDDAAESWFAKQNASSKSTHRYILGNTNEWAYNTISVQIGEFIRNQPISRNRPHNGRSSQMMLFNLIVPLMLEDDLFILVEQLDAKVQESSQISGIFEYTDRNVLNEFGGTPTSIDLMIKQGDKIQYVVEAKFTETGIGQCSKFKNKDCAGNNPVDDFNLCPLHSKANRLYWTSLKKQGFLTQDFQIHGQCVLARHYQYFRMFLFALETDSQFVLLYDERNPKIISELPLMLSFVPEHHKNRFQTITVQQIVDAIQHSGKHLWIDDFKAKYAI